MARTLRAKRRSGDTVRDGVFQYSAGGCRHHGSCEYCVQNRTFSRADSAWAKDVSVALDSSDEYLFWKWN